MARSAKMKKEPKSTRNVYNAEGSPEMESADDETPGFKKGGKVKKHMKRKEGGHVEGEKEKHRADKKSRGGEVHKRAAGGRTPYTSGHNTTSDVDKAASGHESERPAG